MIQFIQQETKMITWNEIHKMEDDKIQENMNSFSVEQTVWILFAQQLEPLTATLLMNDFDYKRIIKNAEEKTGNHLTHMAESLSKTFTMPKLIDAIECLNMIKQIKDTPYAETTQ